MSPFSVGRALPWAPAAHTRPLSFPVRLHSHRISELTVYPANLAQRALSSPRALAQLCSSWCSPLPPPANRSTSEEASPTLPGG